MAKNKFLLPKLGESITEATILSWSKKVGDMIEEDETLLEIATDKVDSELPSPFAGKVVEILYQEGDIVAVGQAVAIIETMEPHSQENVVNPDPVKIEKSHPKAPDPQTVAEEHIPSKSSNGSVELKSRPSNSKRFYSPLVRAIAELEQMSIAELDQIEGSGDEGRVTKKDIVNYVKRKARGANKSTINYEITETQKSPSVTYNEEEVEIIQMDRMRKLIADHMVRSKKISPHVTSFMEIDITDLIEWRKQVKETFSKKYNQKITYTPIFIEAVAKAITDFPRINASVDEDKIIIKKSVNIGMATATASGNLIVPVLKKVNQMTLLQIVASVNDLAERARIGRLKPDEVQGGTFTLTNVGTFGNTMGTPIINQPQVAILSTGAIRKKPAVIETENGDEIVVRKFMFLSLSYDHRIVDGALGGNFLRRVGDYLEKFIAPESL